MKTRKMENVKRGVRVFVKEYRCYGTVTRVTQKPDLQVCGLAEVKLDSPQTIGAYGKHTDVFLGFGGPYPVSDDELKVVR